MASNMPALGWVMLGMRPCPWKPIAFEILVTAVSQLRCIEIIFVEIDHRLLVLAFPVVLGIDLSSIG